MLLKVGELAKRCGLTVRTLHHYDEIGLLVPSARSESGYRLYDRRDIARLHQIQALRRFGISLADIGALLAGRGASLAPIIDEQLRMLEQQIASATQLHARLARLREQVAKGEEPELADWLTTLELMNMYDKYFSQEELDRLAFMRDGSAANREWAALVDELRAMIGHRVAPSSEEARTFAKRWMAMLEKNTGGDGMLLSKLDEMYLNEPLVRERTGVTPEMRAFVLEAVQETKIRIFERYLNGEEARFLRENYGKRANEWPGLIGEFRREMARNAPADAPAVRALAARWLELFRSYAGDDPATHAKIRNAMANEPELTAGSFVDEALLGYVRAAVGALAEA
jgi:DNA-binding transcriptional MerR regulator